MPFVAVLMNVVVKNKLKRRRNLLDVEMPDNLESIVFNQLVMVLKNFEVIIF